MKNSIKNIITIILLLVTNITYGQVVAEGDTILCDGQQGEVGVTLTAISYAVDLTDSNIYTDDIFGGVINMGFDFDFYGNTYNQVVLSSNNYLSFNTANAGAYSAWPINEAVPNNFDAPMNAILCPWQDIYPGVNGNGTIQYATIGEAPNRIFIASFCGIPMFSCTDICYSSQIKLFETTNVIETHIAQKVLCDTWNDGAAIHALHNDNGTIAHVVTGLDGIERNYPNDWTCENDGWRFTPNGSNDYILENIEFAPAVAGTDIIWQDEFGNTIGTGGEIVVFPGGDVTFTAGASLCGAAGDWCGFEGGIEGDDVSITFEELSISGESTDITCFEQENGSIEIIAPNEGSWIYELESDINGLVASEESSNSSFIFEYLAPGTYSATITETNTNCVTEALSFIITQPEQVNSVYSIVNVACNGGNDGSIQIELNGGTSPYTTVLGEMTSGIISEQTGNNISFTNLEAGDYFYSAYDEYGCLMAGDELEFTIEEADAMIITESHSDYTSYGISCNGENDGWINIVVTGGTGDYLYNWSNSETTEDLSGLTAGFYSLQVIDENGCLIEIDVDIEEPPVMIIDPGNINTSDYSSYGVSCNGDTDGWIDITVQGGTGIYTYQWSNGETSEDINNLEAGNYFVTATDQNGCTISVDTTIIEPNEMNISETHSDYNSYGVSCNGGENGSIDLTVNGGTEIYTYAWSNGEAIEDIENLPAGIYSVTATDQNGCSRTIDVDITEPTAMNVSCMPSDYNGYGISCNGGNDGILDISVSGAITPYTYLWSNGENSNSIGGLSAGIYTVVVTDANGCEITQNYTINQPDEIMINAFVDECIDEFGEINVNVYGGLSNYSYQWTLNGEILNNLNNNSNPSGLEEGFYTITATDQNSCIKEMEFILNAAPIAGFSVEEYEFDLSDTAIEFTDESQDSNIETWEWDFGDGNSSDEMNPMHLYTEPGVYYAALRITDMFGCTDQINKKIEVRYDYYAYTPNIFTPNNDGINDTFSPSLLNVKRETYKLLIYDRWGDQIFETNDYSQGWDGKLKDGTFLPSDVYNYKIIYNTKLGDEKIETGRFTMAR